MIVKKYYRGSAAPRPEDWDERYKVLLKSFGGSDEKLEESIRQTLEGLKAINRYEKRTGPGRKSSAEHAIAFYEYVLGSDDKGDSDDDDDEEEEEEDDDDDNENDDDSENDDADAKDDDDDDDDDEEEFLNQHNDACHVCGRGGELLCCSTCSLVFHLECVRPKLDTLPEGEWECPYCIMSSAKKSTRAWKEAAEAVKLMESVKETLSSDGDEDQEDQEEAEACEDKSKNDEESNNNVVDSDEGDQNKDKNTEDVVVDEDTAEQEEEEEGERSEKKMVDTTNDKSSIDSKIVDPSNTSSADNGGDIENPTTTGRGKRSRRRPLMYQPQTVPASKWMSDAPPIVKEHNKPTMEIEEKIPDTKDGGNKGTQTNSKKRSRDSTEDDEEKQEKQTLSKEESKDEGSTTEDQNEEKEIACHFCQDDPRIPICVFCGCRSCYGKHSKDKIVTCDQCENEYHIFCLKPALSSIPVRKWLCPSCKATPPPEVKVSTRRLTTTTSPNKSTTGTRSSSVEKEKVPTPKPPATLSPPNKEIASQKRPRGRPPKNKVSTSPVTTTPSQLKRPRGRPPKNPPKSVSPPPPLPPPPEEPVKRPRGRPPKNKSLSTTAVPPVVLPSPRKKPGPKQGSTKTKRTPVQVNHEEPSPKRARVEVTVPPLEADPSEPVKISRSGRVVKRSSFHDEVEQGEQHLRTTSTTPTRRDENDTTGGGGSGGGSSSEILLPMYEDLSRGYPVEDDLGRDEDDSDEVARPIRTKVIEPPNTIMPSQIPPPLPTLHPPPTPQQQRQPPPLQVDPMLAEVPLDADKKVLLPDPVIPDVSVRKVPYAQTKIGQDAAATRVDPPRSVVVEAVTGNKQGEEASSTTHDRTVASVVSLANESSRLGDSSSSSSKTALDPPSSLSRMQPPIKSKAFKVPTAAIGGGHNDGSGEAGDDEPRYKLTIDVDELVKKAVANIPLDDPDETPVAQNRGPVKVPRRKPGARECMQISRRFGNRVIPKKYMDILMDYCTRGKVEHLIRMRERLDEHALYLESQLAGLETLVREKGTTSVIVPQLPERTPLDPVLGGIAAKSGSPVSSSGPTERVTSPVLDGGDADGDGNTGAPASTAPSTNASGSFFPVGISTTTNHRILPPPRVAQMMPPPPSTGPPQPFLSSSSLSSVVLDPTPLPPGVSMIPSLSDIGSMMVANVSTHVTTSITSPLRTLPSPLDPGRLPIPALPLPLSLATQPTKTTTTEPSSL